MTRRVSVLLSVVMKVCIVCDNEYQDSLTVCPKDGASLMPGDRDPYIGQVIQDRYKIESLVGKGSMGAVYRASQNFMNRDVAVKILLQHLGNDADAIKRFQREAKAASKLNHKHITTLYDFGMMPDGQPYLVMDYLDGVSLGEVLETQEYLPVDEFRPILRQVCEALGEAHRRGIIHRDIKPDNIVLLEQDGRKDYVKLVDFGVAKLMSDDSKDTKLTKTGTICGSPAYLSPEQARSQPLDHRTDIYSLGIVIFELLTGKLPFTSADLINLLFLHATEPPPLINEVRPDLRFSPELVSVVNRCLAKDPNDRPQSMEELWREFDAACQKKMDVPNLGSITGQHKRVSVEQAKAMRDEAARQPVSSAPVAPVYEEEPEDLQPAMSLPPEPPPPEPIELTQVLPQPPLAHPMLNRVTSDQPKVASEPLSRPFVHHSDTADQLRRFAPFMVAGLVVLFIGIFLYNQFGKPSPQWLLEHGRPEEALHALQVEQSSGKLQPGEFEQLNNAYIAVATKYEAQGRLEQAVAMLNHVSPKSKKYTQARRQARKLKRKIRNSS